MDVKKIKNRPTVCIRHLIDEPRLRRRQQQIFIYGFRTYGQRSSGFGLVYDKLEDAIKYEPSHKLVKNGIRDRGKKTKKNTGKKRKENPWCHAKKIRRLFNHSHHHLHMKN